MSDAMRILSERLARGEISVDEFERTRSVLGAQAQGTRMSGTQANPLSGAIAPLVTLSQLVRAAAAAAVLGSIMYAAQLAGAPRGGEAALDSLRLVTGEAVSPGLVISAIADLTCAVLSLIWMHRATSNLRRRSTEQLKISPAWAVGWWFVPVAFLLMPFRAVRQLWTHSQAEGNPVVLRMWWFLLLIYAAGASLIAYFVPVALKNGATQAVPLYLNAGVVLEGLHIGAAVLWGLIVQRISIRQQAWVDPAGNKADQPAKGWRENLGPVALATVAAAGLAVKAYQTPDRAATPASTAGAAWRMTGEKDSITDAITWRIQGSSSTIEGDTRTPARLTFACSGRVIDVYIRFDVPLEDAYPDGDVDMVAGILRLDDGSPERLGFVPTRDWLAVTNLAEGPLGAFAGVVTSLGSVLSRSGEFSTAWTPSGLARAMSASRKMLFRVETRSGGDVTAHFDLIDFKKAYDEWPAHCRGGGS